MDGDARRLVPCVGGPSAAYGVLVAEPLPFEVERDRHGVYVLDELGAGGLPGPVYVYVPAEDTFR